MNWLATLLIGIYPLGISPQSIAMAIVLLTAGRAAFRQPTDTVNKLRPFAVPMALAFAFSIWTIIATLLNSANPARPFGMFAGLSGWWAAPALLVATLVPVAKETWLRWWRFLAIVCLLWGAVAVSQALVGWRVEGVAFVADTTRPRGFYSHPLTLAYAALMLWPFVLGRLLAAPRLWEGWAATLGIGLILVLTQSRTVQAVAAIAAAVLVLQGVKGRARVVALALFAMAALAVLGTNNTIGQRFQKTFSGEGLDRKQGTYADDRLAFWAVHLAMVRERPLIGHGNDLNTAYRTPYYDRMGLTEFTKKYEAHNLFLQILADDGAIGLVVFLAWVATQLRLAWRLDREHWGRPVMTTTWLAFLAAGVTQNSFQDGEVRNGLSFFVAASWLLAATTAARASGRLSR